MKKKIILPALILTILAGFSHAQICDPVTPVFTVDLTGNPNGTWISPSVTRAGYCCTASGSDVCIEFILTLDSMASGISFNIASGAVPPGALYYQVNCGPMILVGQPICLYGTGPHLLTFCKPGNNPNSFSITSVPEPYMTVDASNIASTACQGIISVAGLDESTISWTSIPPNALYNSYLSCTTACDTVTVTPTGSFPPYVDYLVCGTPYPPCAAAAAMCDTVRVNFYNDVSVTIAPQNIVLCNGGTNTTTVTATPSNGIPPYNILWSTGATTASIVAGSGTYTVSVTDSVNCYVATDVVTIVALNPMAANAGPDILICSNQTSVNLNGSVQTATGGQWLGGTGTFNPNNLTLNAVYTPSPSEVSNGFVNLVLQTTGTQGCPDDFDTLHITIAPMPVPNISGNVVVCAGSTANYSIMPPLNPGSTFQWTVTGGTINGSSTGGTVNVTWTSGSGTVTLTETTSSGCVASVTLNVSFVTLPNPVITGNTPVCQFNTETYSITPGAGNTVEWTVTGGTMTGNGSSNSINVTWNTIGTGNVMVTETNNFGCAVSDSKSIVVMVRPVPTISGSGMGCVNSVTYNYTSPMTANTNYFWSTAGGTIMSVNGPNNISVMWNNAGNNSVTLRLVNTVSGCDSTVTLPVNVEALAPLTVQPSAISGCPPLLINFTGNNPAPGQTYAWTFGDGGYSVASNPSHTYYTSGVMNLTVITRNNTGCADTGTAVLSVFSAPDGSFIHNYLGSPYFVGEGNLLIDNTTPNGHHYMWTFGTGDTSVGYEPDYIYRNPGNYIITMYAYSPWGCVDIASQPIEVRLRESYYIPNAFSPNGNDVNDYFSVKQENLASLSIVIFNRWGEVIYTSNDKNFMWDGTYNGSRVQQGIYGYILTTRSENGDEETQNGTITVVK